MTGWPWPLDAVQGFFTSSFSSVWSWVEDAKNKIWGFTTWLKDQVWDKIVWLKDQLWGFFTWVKDQVWDRIAWLKDQVWGFFDWLRTQIVGILSGIQAAAGTIAAGIWSQLGPALTGLKDSVWGFFSDLWNNKIKPGLDNLVTLFRTKIVDPIWNFFSWLWNEKLWPYLSQELWPSLEGLFNKLTGGAYGIAKWLAGEIYGHVDPQHADEMNELTGLRSAFDGAMLGLPDVLKTQLKPMSDFFANLTLEKLQAAMTGLFDQVKTFTDKWQSDVGIGIAGGSPVTPEEAANRVPVIVGSGLAAEIGVDILGIMVEAMGVGQLETPYWALGSLLRTLGIEGTVSRTIGMRVERGIWVPYMKYLNKELRPEALIPFQIDAAYFQGNIDVIAWRNKYEYMGIPDSQIDAWYKSMFRHPTVMQLIRMGEAGINDPVWFDTALRAGALGPVDREKVLEMIERRSVIDEIKMMRSRIISDYAEGYSDIGEVTSFLAGTGHKEKEISLLTDYAERLADNNYRKEWITLHIEEYRKGQATEKQLAANLGNLIKDPDKVHRKVILEQLRKLKLAGADTSSEQRIAFSSVVVTRFKEGFIDRAQMNLELSTLQQIADPMQLAAYVAELSYNTDYKLDLQTFWTAAFAKDVIDEEEYTAAMAPIVVVPERLTAKIQYQIIKKFKKPKAEKPAIA